LKRVIIIRLFLEFLMLTKAIYSCEVKFIGFKWPLRKKRDRFLMGFIIFLGKFLERRESILRFNVPYLSVSEISQQYYCERKVEMARVLGKIEKEHEIIGREVHEILQRDAEMPFSLNNRTFEISSDFFYLGLFLSGIGSVGNRVYGREVTNIFKSVYKNFYSVVVCEEFLL